MTELANPGTKQWEKEVKKAFKNPQFNYELPQNIHAFNSFPKYPKPDHFGKITKYKKEKYFADVRKAEKENKMKLFLLRTYAEYYVPNHQ